MTSPRIEKIEKIPEESGRPSEGSPVQVLARSMKYWFLLLGIGLGAVGVTALYFGLFVVASTLGSIVFVALTLYAFLKFWPEEEFGTQRPPSAEPLDESAEPQAVMVPVVRMDGQPRASFMLAIRDIARRQEKFKISKQGAERFAKTIRYLLRHG